MAQVVTAYNSTGFTNPSNGLYYVDDNHLQIQVPDASTIARISIWMEREGDNTSPLDYELYSELEANVPYQFALDTNVFLTDTLPNSGITELSVAPESHSLTFDIDTIKYVALYKYGKIEQNSPLFSTNAYWLEKKKTNIANVYAKITFIDGNNWISFSDDNGHLAYITPNNSGRDRRATITYYYKFTDSEANGIVKVGEEFIIHQLEITQVYYKIIELKYQAKIDEKYSKYAVPISINYTHVLAYNKFWDTVTKVNTLSNLLKVDGSVGCQEIEFSVNTNNVVELGSSLGDSNNEIIFKWQNKTFKSANNYANSTSGDTFSDINVSIDPHGIEHVAYKIVDIKEDSTIVYEGMPYFEVTYYPSCLVLLKHCLTNTDDRGYSQTMDELVTESQTIANKLNLKEDDVLTIVPYNYEITNDVSTPVDFTLTQLQEVDGVYAIKSNFVTIDDSTNKRNGQDVIICDIETNIATSNGFIEEPLLTRPNNEDHYYFLDKCSSELKVEADFTSSNDTTTKGIISLTPGIIDIIHSCDYFDKYDNEIINRTLKIHESKPDYIVYDYNIKLAEPWSEDRGIKIVNTGYTWTQTDKLAETADVNYSGNTIEDGATLMKPFFNLHLSCKQALPHHVEWSGYRDTQFKPVYAFIGIPNESFTNLTWKYGGNGGNYYTDTFNTLGKRFIYGYHYKIESLFESFKAANFTTFEIEMLNTDQCSDMSYAFMDCSNCVSLDIDVLKTSNVTNMSYMFLNMSKIPKLHLPNFDTAKVTNMEGMFKTCSELSDLNIKSFNTGQVRNMSDMFNGCKNLVELDICHFDTANVTTMKGMFEGCSKLNYLLLTNMDNQRTVFKNNVWGATTKYKPEPEVGDKSLDTYGDKTLPLVKQQAGLNYGYKLGNLQYPDDVEDTTKIMNRIPIMKNAYKFALYHLSNFDTSKVTDMSRMFMDCSSMVEFNLTDFDTSNVTTMNSMFRNCSSVDTLTLASFKTGKVTNYADMFNGCSNLTHLNLYNFSVPSGTVTNMFANCPKLEFIECSDAFKSWCLGSAGQTGLIVGNITWSSDL